MNFKSYLVKYIFVSFRSELLFNYGQIQFLDYLPDSPYTSNNCSTLKTYFKGYINMCIYTYLCINIYIVYYV